MGLSRSRDVRDLHHALRSDERPLGAIARMLDPDRKPTGVRDPGGALPVRGIGEQAVLRWKPSRQDVPSPPPATQADGPLRIRPSRRGPLLFSGILEIRSADLETFARIQHPALCRCGHSGHKPFCDGTQLEIGFDQ